MAGKAPAFQFYAMDFVMDTMGWPPEHVGAHIRLMSYQWINGSVPDDLKVIRDITGLRGKSLTAFLAILEKKYPTQDSMTRRNGRLERSRKESEEYREQQAEAGRIGAEKRWGSHSKPNGNPNGENIALQSSSSTSSSNQNQKQERATRLPHDFCVTPAHRYFALENNLPAPDDHIAQFRDYWIGVAGQRGKKLDWDATFRNWLRKATEFKGRAHGERKAQISQDQQRRDFEQLMAESLDGEGDSQATVPQRGLLPDSGAKARSSGGLVAISSTAGSGKV